MNLQYKFNMSSTVLLARCLNVYSCSGNLKTNDNSQSVIMLVFQLFFFLLVSMSLMIITEQNCR